MELGHGNHGTNVARPSSMILQTIGLITIGLVAVWTLVILVFGLWVLFRPLPKLERPPIPD